VHKARFIESLGGPVYDFTVVGLEVLDRELFRRETAKRRRVDLPDAKWAGDNAK
jgi:hypothetical protein